MKGWRLVFGFVLVAVVLTGCSGVKAEVGDTVRVHYTGSLTDGTVFDSSIDREPLEFTIGEGRLIEGFENAVLGMKVGETKTVTIPAALGYPYSEDLVFTLDRSLVQENVQVGMSLQFPQLDGSVINVVVTEVTETTVTVDANHPLAGEDLVFEIELVEIVTKS